MSNSQITLDTEQVLAIATQLSGDNDHLQQLLNDSKSTVDSLSSYWTGQAAEQTRDKYNEFAGKYFQTFHDVLDQYVKFLQRNVAEDYTSTENVNVQLADAFK